MFGGAYDDPASLTFALLPNLSILGLTITVQLLPDRLLEKLAARDAEILCRVIDQISKVTWGIEPRSLDPTLIPDRDRNGIFGGCCAPWLTIGRILTLPPARGLQAASRSEPAWTKRLACGLANDEAA
jgi:hypothetical protein